MCNCNINNCKIKYVIRLSIMLNSLHNQDYNKIKYVCLKTLGCINVCLIYESVKFHCHCQNNIKEIIITITSNIGMFTKY